MRRLSRKRGRAFGAAFAQYFTEEPGSFKDPVVMIAVALGVFVISAWFDIFNRKLYHSS
jgi:hypothetical protein